MNQSEIDATLERLYSTTNPTPAEDQPVILEWFTWDHLPEHLQQTSKPFGVLARMIAKDIPPGPERGVALRKLLEAKDAAVRATVKPGM